MSTTNGHAPALPAISPDVAHERGYLHVTSLAQLKAHEARFLDRQQQTPGLLIPQYRLGLTPVHAWSLRPDKPRLDNSGSKVKYEHPAGVPLCLDVLPCYREALQDPTIPIWITEGAKKADALASAFGPAIVPININGVWGWRRKYKDGSSFPLDDFEAVAWDGRPVVLAFDNDVTRKPEVQQALRALTKHLKGEGASVRVLVLPDDGEKLGVDDALAGGMTPSELIGLVQDMDALQPKAVHQAPEPSCRPLPAYAQLDPALAASASPWLDAYIAFSRQWSPLAYDGFHEACGLWLLSTLAARRVAVPISGMKYSSLYIALTARTSVWAKSTTAEIALDTLRHVGASYLLAPDECTPQALISQMSAKVPQRYGDLDSTAQFRIQCGLGFAGQKGWWYDEFGQKLAGMMREGGSMQDFRGLLRQIDVSPDRYSYNTITRGLEEIERPYLSILASMTPADLAPYAQNGSALWSDGFFARWAFVAPPVDARPTLEAAFPQGQRIIPPHLVMPLQQWHSRLGTPTVDLEERTRNGKGTGEYTATITPADVQVCSLSDDAYAAYLAYFKAMRGLIISSDDTDMDGSYTRFPEKALRIAMLLASLENTGRIEVRHWARGQQIAEEWRANLHNLIDQLAGQSALSKASILEDKMVQKIIHLGGATINDLRRHIRGISTDESTRVLDSLVQAGSLAFTANSKGTKKYYVPEDDASIVDIGDTIDSRQQQNMSTIEINQSQNANRRHIPALSPMSTVYDVYDSPATSEQVEQEKLEPESKPVSGIDHDLRRDAEVAKALTSGDVKAARKAANQISGRKEQKAADQRIDEYVAAHKTEVTS